MKTNRTRVLLVYPEIPRSFWDFKKSVHMLGLDATLPPLGLITVAAMLPQEHFTVYPVIDLNFRTLSEVDIQWTDIVMISAMLVQRDSVREIITRVKKLGKVVVVGGAYPTSYKDEVLAMGADHLILNEAEITMPPFIEDWIQGKAERVYDKESVKGRVTIELNNEGNSPLSNTPIPRYDLIEIHRYSSMPVQFSRGCPFDCEFCDVVNLFGHIPRTKTPEQMITEIETIWKTGWRGSIFMVDDNFIGNRVKVREFLLILIEWQKKHGFPFSFYTEASMNLADELEILRLMVEAGFEEVFVGIESTDPEALAAAGKRQNKGNLDEKVATIQRAGLNVTAGFIIGLDGDKKDSIQACGDFIQRNGIVIAMAGLLTAIRGTKLYRRLHKEGRLLGESNGNNTHHFDFNFQPLLEKQKLIDGYRKLLAMLYSPKSYYDRCRTLRRNLGLEHRHSGLLRWSSFLAMVRVFMENLRRMDFEFFKFIVETIIAHPRYFPEAVSQAVKFAHFRQITADSLKE